MVKDCEKLKKKKKKDAQQGKTSQKKTYPKYGTCGKTNHPEERCWQGSSAHLKPKRTRPEDSSDNDPDSRAPKPHYKPNIVKFPVFIQERQLKKLASPRLRFNQLVSVRQYIRSDPPTKIFHDYEKQLMG